MIACANCRFNVIGTYPKRGLVVHASIICASCSLKVIWTHSQRILTHKISFNWLIVSISCNVPPLPRAGKFYGVQENEGVHHSALSGIKQCKIWLVGVTHCEHVLSIIWSELQKEQICMGTSPSSSYSSVTECSVLLTLKITCCFYRINNISIIKCLVLLTQLVRDHFYSIRNILEI